MFVARGRGGKGYWYGWLVGLLMGLLSLHPASTWARVQLNGVLEVEYGIIDIRTRVGEVEQKATNRQILQRYQLNLSGDILDPRVATYTLSLGFQDSSYRADPFVGQSQLVTRDTLTYSLLMNWFPVRWPLQLFAQRNIIGTEKEGDLITDTYTVGWILGFRNLPVLRINWIQINTDFQDPASPRKTRVRILNLGLSRRFVQSSLSLGYQQTRYHLESPGEESNRTVHTYTFRGEKTFSPSLSAFAHAVYYPRGTAFVPGVSTFSETIAGFGVHHRVGRFRQQASYDFYRSAGTDVIRHFVGYSAVYRPRGKTDYRADVVVTDTEAPTQNTLDYRVSGGIVHRPFYGLSLTGNLLLNHTRNTNQETTRRDRLGLSGGVNFFRGLDQVNLTTGYLLDLTLVQSNRPEEEGRVWTHTASLGIQTRTLTWAQIGVSYALLLRDNTINPVDDRQDHTWHIGLLSTAIPRAVLRASGDVTYTRSFGFRGTTTILDSRIDYFPIPGLETRAGIRYTDNPQYAGTLDFTTYLLEARYLRQLTLRTHLTLTGHWDRDAFETYDKDRYFLSGLLQYRLGKILFSLDGRIEEIRYPDNEYRVQSLFARLSRPF